MNQLRKKLHWDWPAPNTGRSLPGTIRVVGEEGGHLTVQGQHTHGREGYSTWKREEEEAIHLWWPSAASWCCRWRRQQQLRSWAELLSIARRFQITDEAKREKGDDAGGLAGKKKMVAEKSSNTATTMA